MEVTLKTVNFPEKLTKAQTQGKVVIKLDDGLQKGPLLRNQQQTQQSHQQQQYQQQPQQKMKRKHRRGKPKAKNTNKSYKKTNWRFQLPYRKCGSVGGSGGCNRRQKLQRSRSLVPYNTNKFLMEEHLAEVPSALLTPTGRTRDSSFSMDSEDNYFFSLPEDEEEFLTKEFANVYEKARVERLENLSKQELIAECLQIEDRYSNDQGNHRQQQLHVQRIAQEYIAKIRVLDEKVKELSRENHILRCQLMRSAVLAAAAAASPPSAAAPMGAACQPTPMESSSEDSESDSSTSSSSSSSSYPSSNNDRNQGRRRRSCSSHSSLSEYNGYVENNNMHNNVEEEHGGGGGIVIENEHLPPAAAVMGNLNDDHERQQLLNDQMDDGKNNVYEENTSKLNDFHTGHQQSQRQRHEQPNNNLSPIVNVSNENNAGIQNIAANGGNNGATVNLQNPSTQ